METLLDILFSVVFFVVVVGAFAFIFGAFLDFVTQPYEHSDEVKRMLYEK